jgi:hypothetical protein
MVSNMDFQCTREIHTLEKVWVSEVGQNGGEILRTVVGVNDLGKVVAVTAASPSYMRLSVR